MADEKMTPTQRIALVVHLMSIGHELTTEDVQEATGCGYMGAYNLMERLRTTTDLGIVRVPADGKNHGAGSGLPWPPVYTILSDKGEVEGPDGV